MSDNKASCITCDQASEASRALELNRAEALHLRSHNAVLEETLAEVSLHVQEALVEGPY